MNNFFFFSVVFSLLFCSTLSNSELVIIRFFLSHQLSLSFFIPFISCVFSLFNVQTYFMSIFIIFISWDVQITVTIVVETPTVTNDFSQSVYFLQNFKLKITVTYTLDHSRLISLSHQVLAISSDMSYLSYDKNQL